MVNPEEMALTAVEVAPTANDEAADPVPEVTLTAIDGAADPVPEVTVTIHNPKAEEVAPKAEEVAPKAEEVAPKAGEVALTTNAEEVALTTNDGAPDVISEIEVMLDDSRTSTKPPGAETQDLIVKNEHTGAETQDAIVEKEKTAPTKASTPRSSVVYHDAEPRGPPTDYCYLCVVLCGLALILALPVYMIVLGEEHKDNECEKDLSTWLLVAGGTALGFIVLQFVFKPKTDPYTGETRFHPLMGCITCLRLGWFIVGCVWIFGINRDNHVCPDAMYEFSYIYIIVMLCILSCGCVCSCCYRLS